MPSKMYIINHPSFVGHFNKTEVTEEELKTYLETMVQDAEQTITDLTNSKIIEVINNDKPTKNPVQDKAVKQSDPE